MVKDRWQILTGEPVASRMICPIRRGYTTSRCRARFIYSNLKASELGIAEHHSESRRRRSNSSEVHVTKCRCPLQNEMNHFHIVGVQSLHINPTHCLLHYILAQLSHFLKGDCVLSLSVPTNSGIAAFLAGCFNISHATTTPSCGPPGYLYGKDKASPMTQKRSRDALAGLGLQPALPRLCRCCRLPTWAAGTPLDAVQMHPARQGCLELAVGTGSWQGVVTVGLSMEVRVLAVK